ncbi:hypothetical protein HELRODRAFT_168487 [Helobdella robusta]|uniref:Sulfotransferase domain-containing protein n=1 Tax=Helobdella robusta TaxID=6412 RepID=T1F0M5_HELRO|nr:hypothetical protein HELRODRAFT_168487 [Helobdella robusta]ESO09494.1 hypothetical protein HELRODRAFT_168487 [Helobdella robusta]
MHWIFVYTKLARYALWLTANLIFKVLQWMVWECTGVASTLRQATKNPRNKKAVQKLRVRSKFKFCEYLFPASFWDFLTTHERFEPPEYVLQDHITLYSVTHAEAIFVETKPGVKVWDTKVYPPFFMAAQFFNVVNVLRMPIDCLHKLAEKIGDPMGELILLANCARCGSTLLTQMFHFNEKIISFSEPNCLNFLSRAADYLGVENAHNVEFERLTRNTIRILCKRTQSGNEIAYAIKVCSPCLIAIPFINKLFSNAKSMFLYRNPIKVSQSIYRLSCNVYSIGLIFHAGKGSRMRMGKIMGFIGLPESYYRHCLNHDFAVGVGVWYAITRQYFDCLKEFKNFPAIKYVDIVKHPAKSLEIIFKHCGLPTDLIPKALEALKHDSQKGTPAASDVLNKFPLLVYEGEAKIECENLAKNFGFPDPTEEYIIENTITKM